MLKAFFFLAPLFAVQASLSPVAVENVGLNTTKGTQMLLAPDTQTWSYFLTMLHLPTQKTQTYCSIASSVMVLNSLASDRAPIDRDYDPYPYWTQDNFFNGCTDRVKSQIKVLEMGASLDELAVMLQCHDVNTSIVFGSETNVEDFRALLTDLLTVPEKAYVVVNFLRTGVYEEGGGHFSPLVALDPVQDMVLIADVTRYKYAPTWVSIPSLYSAINTTDNTSGKSRGLMLMS